MSEGMPGILPGDAETATRLALAQERVLGTDDVAAILGIPPQAASRLCREGEIPAVRIAGRYYVLERLLIDRLTPREVAESRHVAASRYRDTWEVENEARKERGKLLRAEGRRQEKLRERVRDALDGHIRWLEGWLAERAKAAVAEAVERERLGRS